MTYEQTSSWGGETAAFDGTADTDDDGYRDPDIEGSTSLAKFEGDDGGMDYPARHALVVLLQNRFITSRSHPAAYKALVANARSIGQRLNDMFLTLELDTQREVAFKRQVSSPTGTPFPTLLRAHSWSREETILLARLRALSRAATNAGHTTGHVDRQDLLEHVASLRPSTATNQAADESKTNKAIDNLVSAGVLIGRQSGDEFEIAVRAIEVLLDLPTLKRLLAWISPEAAEPALGADLEER